MFEPSYSELGEIEKQTLGSSVHNYVLLNLLAGEIGILESQLCNLEIGPDLVIEYTIIQQRLSVMQELKEFLEQVQKDTLNPPSE